MNIDYNNEAVAAFSAQCDEFIGSKLIMSNQKIRMLLRCMAYYDELKNSPTIAVSISITTTNTTAPS